MAFVLTDLGGITSFSSGFGQLFLSTNVPSGSLIMVLAADQSDSTSHSGPTDSQGNTYVPIGSFLGCNNNISANGFGAVWLSLIATPLASGTDKIFYSLDGSFGTRTNLGGVSCTMITGADPGRYTSGALNTAFGNGTAISVSTTPNFTNSLMIGFFAASQTSNSFTAPSVNSPASGFTTPPPSQQQTTSGSPAGDEALSYGGYLVQPTIASVTFAPTLAQAFPWAAFIFEIPVLVASAVPLGPIGMASAEW